MIISWMKYEVGAGQARQPLDNADISPVASARGVKQGACLNQSAVLGCEISSDAGLHRNSWRTVRASSTAWSRASTRPTAT